VRRLAALIVLLPGLSLAQLSPTPSGQAIGPAGASTQTANSAAGNEPSTTTDGVILTNQCRAAIIVSAASGETLSGGGTLKLWWLDTTQTTPRWNLLVEGTDPAMTGAAARRDVTVGVRKTFPYGRLYVEADTVTASGGALTVRVLTFTCKAVTAAPAGGSGGMFAVLGLVRDAALAQVEVEAGGGPTGLTGDGSNLTATVPYRAPAGSCAAPAFAWSADADGTGSGWYRQAANVWSLCLNGVEVARFTGTELQMLASTSLLANIIKGPTGTTKWDLSTPENLILNQVAATGVGTRFRNSVFDMTHAGQQLQVINGGVGVWGVSGIGGMLVDMDDGTGTPGNVTQNRSCGRAAVAATASTVTVTSSTVAATSFVFAQLQEADATCTAIKSVDPAAGSFVLTVSAACTADTDFGWCVISDPG